MDDEQRRRNRRTGLILASIALVFMFGYVVRRFMLGS
ncbi:MAG: cytochrome oxidase small assembly protein [Pigmentiphaga sp.]|nr:cytochrome oxidase small assembly protein [Pigmentiphaga sp.]